MKQLISLTLLFLLSTVVAADIVDVKEVIVSGTEKISPDKVKLIADIHPGDSVDAAKLKAVKNRLLDSGLFESVSIDIRYDELSAEGQAVLVISVEERRSWWSDLTIRPQLIPSSEFGFSAGVEVGYFDLFRPNEIIAVPLVFGGQTNVGIELREYFDSAIIDRLVIGGGYIEQENPHFELIDERGYFDVAIGRRIRGLFFELLAGYADVKFADLEDDFTRFGARISIDTRRDIFLPDDAVFLGLEVQRYQFGEDSAADDATIFRLDARGYKHLFGRTILAASARAEISDVALPDYLKPYLGGVSRLRGFDEGEFIGDNLAIGSLELRLPVSPLTSSLLYGLHGFYNVGSVYDDGVGIGDVRFLHGYGIGAFFTIEDLGVVIDLGTNQENDDVVLHVGSQFSF